MTTKRISRKVRRFVSIPGKRNKVFIGLRGNVISRARRIRSIFHRKGS